MKKVQHTSEKGQVLVLIVLSMVVLLGFTALAVDGGMVYSDRRHAQNASDAASLAGIGAAGVYMEEHNINYYNWGCPNTCDYPGGNCGNVTPAMAKAITAAQNRAADNDYTIGTTLSSKNGVVATCGVENNGSWEDKYIDIETMITRDTRTAFIHFVYGGPVRNTVQAIARIRPRTPMAFGNAIVALSQVCQGGTGGVNFMGTSDTAVTGGGIFSNACVTANGSTQISLESPYKVTCVGDACDTNWNPANGPTPDKGKILMPEDMVDLDAIAGLPQSCANLPARSYNGGEKTLLPGRYSRIRLNSQHDIIEMESGLYCVDGEFRANGGSLTGHGVTIYEINGDMDISGANYVDLTAPPARNCSYCPPALAGVLIYMDKNNSGEVSLLGSADNQYLGLVFVPSGTIEVGGTADEISLVQAQLIGNTVDVHGTAQVVVNFDGEENPSLSPKAEVYK